MMIPIINGGGARVRSDVIPSPTIRSGTNPTLDYTTQARYAQNRAYMAERGGVIATTVANSPPSIKGPFAGLTSGSGAITRGNAPVLPVSVAGLPGQVSGMLDSAGAKVGVSGMVLAGLLVAVAVLAILAIAR